MNEFDWSNYIGDHMEEALRVQYCTHGRSGEFKLKPEFRFGVDEMNIIISMKCALNECRPLLRSANDLSNAEIAFVLYDGEIETDSSRAFFINSARMHGEVKKYILECLGVMGEDPQKILNRLYSLHVALNYEELIEKEIALRK